MGSGSGAGGAALSVADRELVVALSPALFTTGILIV